MVKYDHTAGVYEAWAFGGAGMRYLGAFDTSTAARAAVEGAAVEGAAVEGAA